VFKQRVFVRLVTKLKSLERKLGMESIPSENDADFRLKPEEYTGGTFTISNLGMNDAIDQFTAIVKPHYIQLI
jgi:pyruvate dehydrogenase E2 component (dihydrolipoamide acetyltransferase)